MAVSNSTYKNAIAIAGNWVPVFRINCAGSLIIPPDSSPSWRNDSQPGYYEGDGFRKYNALYGNTSAVPWVKGATIPDYVQDSVYNTIYLSQSYIYDNLSDIYYEIYEELSVGTYMVRLYTGDDSGDTGYYFEGFLNEVPTGRIEPRVLFGGNYVTGVWDSIPFQILNGVLAIYLEPFPGVFFNAIEILKLE